MTYAPTVAYLKESALAAGAKSFWHGKTATQSINYDALFPQADLLLLNPTLQVSGGNVVYEGAIYFYGNDQLENSADQSVNVLDAIDRITQRFVAILAESDDFELGDEVRRQPLYREGSMIGTGFALAFTLTAKALCL